MNIKGKIPLKPGQEIQFIGFVKSFLRSLNGVVRQQKPHKVLKHFYWERLSKSERRQMAALLATLDDSLDSHLARIHKSTNRSSVNRKTPKPPTKKLGVRSEDLQGEGVDSAVQPEKVRSPAKGQGRVSGKVRQLRTRRNE